MSWFGFMFLFVVLLPIIVGLVLPEDDRDKIISIFWEDEQVEQIYQDDPTPVYTEKLHNTPAPHEFEAFNNEYNLEYTKFNAKMKQDCIRMGLSNC